MENRITVREAITEIEIAAFWEQLYNYYKRDIFPDSVDGEQNHFLGVEYRPVSYTHLIQKNCSSF